MIGEEAYLGKGYGRESVRALIKEVEKYTPTKRIIVQPECDNKASRNTLVSAGFLYDEANDVYYKNL
ncbi:GNAT family N-acetyltransferase [Cellulosilyticum ruminicola]|uniref:GNAT family N-acetyltransferase n=1 Tax=Cellulosilyticum ruminicola TaxID=425254 RepID=UPI0006CF3044|nr:GNAT family N-acetyltransferase [Cellulosilyticum ruminicola]